MRASSTGIAGTELQLRLQDQEADGRDVAFFGNEAARPALCSQPRFGVRGRCGRASQIPNKGITKLNGSLWSLGGKDLTREALKVLIDVRSPRYCSRTKLG